MFAQVVALFYKFLPWAGSRTSLEVMIAKKDIELIKYPHVNEDVIDLQRKFPIDYQSYFFQKYTPEI